MTEEECDSEKDISSPEHEETQPPPFTSIAVQTELSMQGIDDLKKSKE